LDPLLHTRLQPSSWEFFTNLLPRLKAASNSFVPTLEAWSLVERQTVIGLYESFFFQSEKGAYPMFHMPSLKDMPGFLSTTVRGKQPRRVMDLGRDVSAKPVLRSATPEAGANVAAAAASRAVAVADAAKKAHLPVGRPVPGQQYVARSNPTGPTGVELQRGAAKAKTKKSIAAAAEEDAKVLEARQVWTHKCGTCSKHYHTCRLALESLLESTPAKGKLALQAGVLTHTRTPAHPHTRTCA
jgi:hypothetical protein